MSTLPTPRETLREQWLAAGKATYDAWAKFGPDSPEYRDAVLTEDALYRLLVKSDVARRPQAEPPGQQP